MLSLKFNILIPCTFFVDFARFSHILEIFSVESTHYPDYALFRRNVRKSGNLLSVLDYEISDKSI